MNGSLQRLTVNNIRFSRSWTLPDSINNALKKLTQWFNSVVFDEYELHSWSIKYEQQQPLRPYWYSWCSTIFVWFVDFKSIRWTNSKVSFLLLEVRGIGPWIKSNYWWLSMLFEWNIHTSYPGFVEQQISRLTKMFKNQ